MKYKYLILSMIIFIGACKSVILFETNIINKNKNQEKSTINIVAYEGWANCIEMKNKQLKVVLVPQIARVMFFGETNGPNHLWSDETLSGILTNKEKASKSWTNFGGEKLWIAPQMLNSHIRGKMWPPDYYTDAHPWEELTIDGNSVTVTGIYSPTFGLSYSRIFTLEKNTLVIKTTLHNYDKQQEFSIAPWSIAQFKTPEKVAIEKTLSIKTQPDGYAILNIGMGTSPALPTKPKEEDNELIFTFPKKQNAWKVGVHSSYMKAYYKDATITIKTFPVKGRRYLDKDSCVEMYASEDAKYIELETLGLPERMQANDQISSETHWIFEKK